MFDARLDDQVKLSGEFRRFRDASYTQLDAYLELFNGEGRPMISAAKTGVTTATYIRLP